MGVLLASTAMLSTLSGGAAAQAVGPQPYTPGGAVQEVVADSSGYGGQLALPMGGSRILRFERPIGQVMVGNPKVGDVIPLGDRTIYVLAKATGVTSVTVMPRGGGAPLATLDVRVGYDVDNIRRAVQQIMPGEPVEVTAQGDGIVLSGSLSSSAAAARAASIAEQYAAGHVANLTSIRAAEQVMLSVRVAEVQRSALQQLGLNNFNAMWDTTHSFVLPATALNPDKVANLIGETKAGKNWTFSALFDALETHGYASTLAEPNLVALSGETAVFFAGGEIPVPVPQLGINQTTVVIEWKQYGVSIGFTPTVVGDSINLAVAPEVSALDPANAVLLQGFKIPALTTRRAKTTVEMRNGQSFAIAGLIRREFTDSLRGLPGAQRTPLFGALFRSTNYQNNESEVIIIVTAHLAKPTDQQNLVAPTDLRQGPSEAEMYFGGMTDKPLPSGRPGASLSQPSPLAADSASDVARAVAEMKGEPAPAPRPASAPPPVAMVAPSAPVAPTPRPEPAPQLAAPAVTMAPQPIEAPKPVVASAPVSPAPKPAAPLAAAAPAVKPAVAPAVAPTAPAPPALVVAASLPAAKPAPAPTVVANLPAPKPAAPPLAAAVPAPKPAAVVSVAPAPKPAAPATPLATATPASRPMAVPSQAPAPAMAAKPVAAPPAVALNVAGDKTGAPQPAAAPKSAPADHPASKETRPEDVAAITRIVPAQLQVAAQIAKPTPTLDPRPAHDLWSAREDDQ